MKRIIRIIPGRDLVKNIFATATFKQSSITFMGTVLNGALGAVFYILAARFLGPASFGLMSVAIAALTLISDIGDFGTDTGLVNFVAKYAKSDKNKANRFLKLGLKLKVVVGTIVMVTGLIFADSIAIHIFAKPELAAPLKISFIGVLAILLFSFAIHTFQALQRFWVWSGIQVGTNAFRVLVIFVLLFTGKLNMETTLIAYITMPFLGFLVALALLPKGFLAVKNEKSVAKEFFKYNKWVAAFTLVAAFSSRLDTFMSARLLSLADVGMYAAANRVVQIVPQIVTALGTVIAPKMAEMGSLENLKSYLKKTQLMVLGLAVLGILSIPVVSHLIPLFFGSGYAASVPLFVILLLAMLVFLVSVPIHSAVFYYFSYPKLFFYISIGHIAIIAGLGWRLISAHGAIGAAVAVLIGAVFNFIVPAMWVFGKIRIQEKLRSQKV